MDILLIFSRHGLSNVKIAVFRRVQPLFARNNSGFTLVELLVSLAIFSLLSLSATVSLSLIGDITRRVDLNYADQTRALSMLQDSLKSTFSYVGQKKSYIISEPEFFDYFYGSPHEITFISTRGVIHNGLVLSRIYQEGSALFLTETRLYDPRYSYLSPDIKERASEPLLLLSGVENFTLRYLRNQKWQKKLTEQFPDLIEIILKDENHSLTVQAALGSRFKQKKSRAEWLNIPY